MSINIEGNNIKCFYLPNSFKLTLAQTEDPNYLLQFATNIFKRTNVETLFYFTPEFNNLPGSF